MLTLDISCWTTSNLPWFMDLTFQIPMQYCSLHHWTLLPSPVTSTAERCFCFGSVSSFFLEIFLYSSSVAYWAPNNLGSSSFSVIYFCLFILLMGFSRQEYWSGLPFPSPVDHVLSELSTMTCLSWVTLHSMTHSFIELDKAVVHVISLISFLWLWFSVVQENVASHGKKRYPKFKGSPSKMVGGAKFRINFHTHQRYSEGSDKTLCAPEPRDSTENVPGLPLNVWVSPMVAQVNSGLL